MGLLPPHKCIKDHEGISVGAGIDFMIDVFALEEPRGKLHDLGNTVWINRSVNDQIKAG